MAYSAFFAERVSSHDECIGHLRRATAELTALALVLQRTLGLTNQEVQGLHEAVAVAAEGHRVCKWSYVHSYFQDVAVLSAVAAKSATADSLVRNHRLFVSQQVRVLR